MDIFKLFSKYKYRPAAGLGMLEVEKLSRMVSKVQLNS